jgi:hypothetical protein
VIDLFFQNKREKQCDTNLYIFISFLVIDLCKNKIRKSIRMPQTCKQSSAKAKEYKRSRNANLSTSKTPINHESQMNYHREKKKSHHNDDSSHSSTGDMGKTDRKKRGGKLKSSSTNKSPNTEDIDSDRDSISSTSEGSYVRRSLIRF